MPTQEWNFEKKPVDGWTWTALAAGLLVLPWAWSSGVLGVGDMVWGTLRGNRQSWWQFHTAGLIAHWVPFLLIWLALRRNGESWQSIGLDLAWFRRRWLWFAGLGVVLVAAAFLMPGVLYEGALPRRSQTHFMAPISVAERLMIILVAVTAGLTEEVIFRGFAFTRLQRVLRSHWTILTITLASFLFLHGNPRSVEQLVMYLIAGAAFGVPFLLMKYRNLHVLVVIHFLIDASMVFAP